MSIAATSRLNVNALEQNLARRVGEVKTQDGKYVKGKMWGSRTWYKIDQQVTQPNSLSKFKVNARLRGEHVLGLEFLKAVDALEPELQEVALNLKKFKEAGDPRCEKVVEALNNNPKLRHRFFSIDNLAYNKDLIKKQANSMSTRNRAANQVVQVSRNLNEVGDWISGWCNTIIDMQANVMRPSNDPHSYKHKIQRFVFGGVAALMLATLARGIREALATAPKVSHGGISPSTVAGLYWFTTVTHGFSAITALVSRAVVDRKEKLSGEVLEDIAGHAHRVISRLTELADVVGDGNHAQQERQLIKGLDKNSGLRHFLKRNNPSDAWFAIKAAKQAADAAPGADAAQTKHSAMIRAVVNFMEGGPDAGRHVKLRRSNQILKIVKVVDNHRTHEADHAEGLAHSEKAVRNKVEEKAGLLNSFCGSVISKFGRLVGNQCIKKRGEAMQCQSKSSIERKRSIKRSSATWEARHPYHPTSILNSPTTGRVARTLMKIATGIEYFGRYHILHSDTNLGRVFRFAFKEGYENLVGKRASALATHALGILAGWGAIGAALTLVSGGLELAGGVVSAAMGGGFRLAFISLTAMYLMALALAAPFYAAAAASVYMSNKGWV